MKLKVRQHSRYNIEIRMKYALRPLTRQRKISMDLYLFSPKNINNFSNFSMEELFTNITRLNRYEAFEMDLIDILDSTNELSPLYRLKNFIKVKRPRSVKTYIYELQMLYSIVHSSFWCYFRESRKAIKHIDDNFVNSICAKLDLLESILKELSSLPNYIAEHRIKLRNREQSMDESIKILNSSFAWTIEGIGKNIFNGYVSVQRLLDKEQKVSDRISRKLDLLSNDIIANKSYSGIPKDSSSNERYSYHLRELKRWRDNCLFMVTPNSKKNYVAKEITFSLASGIAMVIATAITVVSFFYYEQWSIRWIAVAILGYMGKDRIKDWLKIILFKWIEPIIGNRQQIIVDPRSKKPYGKILELIGTPAYGELPDRIKEIRNYKKDRISVLLGHESVFHYQGKILFNSIKLLRNHKRLDFALQLIRLNLQRSILRFDDEQKSLWLFQNSKLKRFMVDRSYHFNLIVASKIDDEPEELSRFRIIFRNNKISDIEHIHTIN